MNKKPRKKRAAYVWLSKPPAQWCGLVRKAGKDGLAVTDAAKQMGIGLTTFTTWERTRPAFAKAAAGVRRNSAERALGRTQKLMAKSEEKLLRALAHVRAQRAAEEERVRLAMEAMGHGSDWGPAKLAQKVQNAKEQRREARADERRKQKQRMTSVSVTTTKYQ